MTPEEQRVYIARAKAFVFSQRDSPDERLAKDSKDKADWAASLADVERLPDANEDELRSIALGLKQRSHAGFWSKFGNVDHLIGWLRHRGRCVYCGDDLIEGEHIRHGLAVTDHLLPYSKYPHLDKHSLNTVPACSKCNCRKRTFDPSEEPAEEPGM